MQFTNAQAMVQHLVQGMTSSFLEMQMGTLPHTQTLATPSPSQVV